MSMNTVRQGLGGEKIVKTVRQGLGGEKIVK